VFIDNTNLNAGAASTVESGGTLIVRLGEIHRRSSSRGFCCRVGTSRPTPPFSPRADSRTAHNVTLDSTIDGSFAAMSWSAIRRH